MTFIWSIINLVFHLPVHMITTVSRFWFSACVQPHFDSSTSRQLYGERSETRIRCLTVHVSKNISEGHESLITSLLCFYSYILVFVPVFLCGLVFCMCHVSHWRPTFPSGLINIHLSLYACMWKTPWKPESSHNFWTSCKNLTEWDETNY